MLCAGLHRLLIVVSEGGYFLRPRFFTNLLVHCKTSTAHVNLLVDNDVRLLSI